MAFQRRIGYFYWSSGTAIGGFSERVDPFEIETKKLNARGISTGSSDNYYPCYREDIERRVISPSRDVFVARSDSRHRSSLG
jgi:hypothetical protein